MPKSKPLTDTVTQASCINRLSNLYDDTFIYLDNKDSTDSDSLKIIKEWNYLAENCADKVNQDSLHKIIHLYQNKN
jgi:hypothetical protein